MTGREKGLTLIEVVIALTVLSIVTYGVFELLDLNNRVFSREEREASVRQEVRQALDRFLKDIQAAGDVVVPDGKTVELIIRGEAGDRRVVYALTNTGTGDPAVYHLYVDGDRLPVRVLSGTDKEDFKLARNMVWIDLRYADDSPVPKEAAGWLQLKTAVLPRATDGSGGSERVLLGILPRWNLVTVAKSASTTNPITAWFSDGTREDVTAAAAYLATPDLIEVVAGSIRGNLAGRAEVAVTYTWGAITKTAVFTVVVTEGSPLIPPFDDVDWVFVGGTGGGGDPGYWKISPDGVEVNHKREAGHEDYGYFQNYRLGTVFDYKMKVTLKNNRNQPGTGGILVHFDGTGAGYVLRLEHQADADKVVPYFGVKGAETISPVEFQPFDGTYELKVCAREGGNYTFFVNDVLVGTLTDSTFQNGYAGIYATCKAGFADLDYVEP